MMPRISVIVACYNAAEYIPTLVRRLRAMEPYEVILLDDASSDDTLAALHAATFRWPQALVLANRENLGVALTRERGLAHATGDYVWFCDADDTFSPSILDVLAAPMEDPACALVVCRAERAGRVMEGVSSTRRIAAEETPFALVSGLIRGYLWNKLFRRSLLAEVPITALSSQSDFLMVAEYIKQLPGGSYVQMLPDVAYTYEVQEGSISTRATTENTAICEHRVRELWPEAWHPRRVRSWEHALNGFHVWFYAVAVAGTHARRNESVPRVTLRGVVDCVTVGRLREAAHALVMYLLGPAYPAAYRKVFG